jgi:hypothetical protein
MPTAYVYAPFTGANWGAATYCYNGANHPSVVGTLPFDIGATAQTATPIIFEANQVVNSVSISHQSGVCKASTGATAPWQNRVHVAMYTGLNATGRYIGTVVYCHAVLSYAAGTYNTRSITVAGIAPDTCNCNANGCCYCGRHCHIELQTPNGMALRTNPSCWSTLYYAGSWIYQIAW